MFWKFRFLWTFWNFLDISFWIISFLSLSFLGKNYMFLSQYSNFGQLGKGDGKMSKNVTLHHHFLNRPHHCPPPPQPQHFLWACVMCMRVAAMATRHQSQSVQQQSYSPTQNCQLLSDQICRLKSLLTIYIHTLHTLALGSMGLPIWLVLDSRLHGLFSGYLVKLSIGWIDRRVYLIIDTL